MKRVNDHYHTNGQLAYDATTGNAYHDNGSIAFSAADDSVYYRNGNLAYCQDSDAVLYSDGTMALNLLPSENNPRPWAGMAQNNDGTRVRFYARRIQLDLGSGLAVEIGYMNDGDHFHHCWLTVLGESMNRTEFPI